MSVGLIRDYLGLRAGYGFYFTTARLFGVDPGQHGGSELTGTLGGYIEGELMPKLSDDENTRVIDELGRVKDFELAKGEIKQIDIRRPGSFGIGYGHIKFVPLQGRSRKIVLRSRVDGDRLVQLAQAFSPDLVRTRPYLSL